MVIKRKRSISELSSPNGASSSSSSSPFSSPSSLNNSIRLSTTTGVTPLHLHSRTMKRFRNGRPSDEEVHERTMGLLYSGAQQQGPCHQQQQCAIQQQMQGMGLSAPVTNQQSLHRFWNITSAPTVSTPTVHQQPLAAPSACDDCGVDLGGNDGMDVDGSGTCGACGKHVCFSCSVSNLGEQRRCLQCVGSKVWIGGIGWTDAASMTVC